MSASSVSHLSAARLITALSAGVVLVGANLGCAAPARTTTGSVPIVAAAPAAPAALAAAPAGTTPAAGAPASAGMSASTSISNRYIAFTARGTTRSVALVSSTTGAVVKTLMTAKSSAALGEEPFRDADLSPDGTAWIVRSMGTNPTFGSGLYKVTTSGRTSLVMPYVHSVRVSRDGSTLAVTVLSPDGDKDGFGLVALRLVNARTGKVVGTLSSYKIPVTKDGTSVQMEYGQLQVAGWLTARTVLLQTGCCDSGAVSFVTTTRTTKWGAWPTKDGDHNTMALGTFGTTGVLVPVSRWVKGSESIYRMVGVDTYKVTAANPKGTHLRFYKGMSDVVGNADRMIKDAGATTLFIAPKHFPYRGLGTITAAFR